MESTQQVYGYTLLEKYPSSTSNHITYRANRENIPYLVKKFTFPDVTVTEKLISDLKSVPRHDLIVLFMDSFQANGFYHLVFEHCDRSFEKVIPLEEHDRTQIVSFVTQVCIALMHLHELGFIHGNLKPSNIFLCPLPQGTKRVKIADMTSEPTLKSGNSWTVKFKDPDTCYRAPETWPLMENDTPYYRDNADTWALGCFAYHLINDVVLFNVDWNNRRALRSQLKEKLMEFQRGRFVKFARECPEALQDVVKEMLQPDADCRKSCHELQPQLASCGDRSVQRLVLKYMTAHTAIQETALMDTEPAEWDGKAVVTVPEGIYIMQPFRPDIWRRMANGEAGAVHFPPLRLTQNNSVLLLILARRMRPPPPARENMEAAAVDRPMVPTHVGDPSKDLRIWAQFHDAGMSQQLHITLQLMLKARDLTGQQSNIILKTSREMLMNNEPQNLLIHFQSAQLVLLDDEQPQIEVQIRLV